MELIERAWNNPYFVLWVSPALFAVAVLFDNDFIGSGAYKKRLDGVVISTLFGGGVSLMLLAPLVDYHQLLSLPLIVLVVSVAGALLYVAHLYYYFDVLFAADADGRPINDGASVELFINLNVLFVPLCAWLLLDQTLSPNQWMGVVVILSALLLMTGVRCIRQTMYSGVLTALMLAAYYLCEEYVYHHVSLENGFFIFSAALAVVGLALLVWPASRPHVSVLSRANLQRFMLAEIVAIMAILTSQQALKLNPVVYVIAIESFTPVFVALLSIVPGVYCRFFPRIRTEPLGEEPGSLATFGGQRENLAIKGASTLIMVVGTLLLLK